MTPSRRRIPKPGKRAAAAGIALSSFVFLFPVAAAAGPGGGGFGAGGFHGGSVGNAGHVNAHPGWGASYGTPAFGDTVDPIGWEDPPPGGAAQPGNSGPSGKPLDAPLPADLGAGKWDEGWWTGSNDYMGRDAAAAAKAGSTVASLPKGYETTAVAGETYYYRNGTFYERGASGYEVIQAPVGAEIRDLPDNGDFVGVGGQQYFVHGETYYQGFYSGSGPVYRVVADPHV